MNHPSSILIVDDTPSGRETLGALFRDHDYHLAFASNGASALVQAAELLPDLILLDVRMPGMDGFEVCRRLRAEPELAEVPIILITALDDRDSRLRGIEAGADDFISKPFDRIELRARVRTIMRLNRYRRLTIERLQRQQAQQEIEHRNHELVLLQEANRLKNQFVSDVAHELRTPLMIMTLTSDNLDTLYDQLNDQQRKKLIHQMRKQMATLNHLVENVLDIARLDSQRQPPEPQCVDLALLAREEADRQAPLARQKAQSLRVAGCQRLMVQGDAGQLRQALCNLLNNALKYTPDGGEIICECCTLAASADPDPNWPASAQLPAGDWAALRVVDTGIGIGQGDLGRIFERFYRVKTQGNMPGTGLGLAITQELVRLHHGHVAVASMPGVGSSFAIYLPLSEEK